MKYLLDTGVWLRSALRPQTVPAPVRSIVGNPDQELAVCVFSFWEVAKKHQKGKLPLPMDLAQWFAAAVPRNLEVLPLTPAVIIESTRLPNFPVNDPADELIVATARVYNLVLLTTDNQLKGYAEAEVKYFKPIEDSV